jgi:tRNA-2-methylthio-N6-dimethylallyladenosine synthase
MLYQLEYDDLYAFAYSPRPQTVAAKIYHDDVPEDVKKKRLFEVLRLQDEISLRKNERFVGSMEEILIEGNAKMKKGRVMGRTRTNKIVNVTGAEEQVGRLAWVRITGATANSLLGEPLDRTSDSLYPLG